MSSLSVGHESFEIVYPWNLFNHQEGIQDAREQVVRKTIRCLETVYGIGKVGN
jgi:hypothetical protein